TEQDIEEGCRRPLNVEGSYAVYHATKGKVHSSQAEAEKYKVGKAFHIYRPIAEDALGNKAWCALHIDGYTDPKNLTITVPQQFLDEATYPVTIDPDFGEEGEGSSWQDIATDTGSSRAGTAWPMPAPGGTVNWVKAYLQGDVPCDVKAIINQKDSVAANQHGEIAGPVANLDCIAAAHWEEFTFADEELTQGVNYTPNVLGNNADMGKGEAYNVAYDENGAAFSCKKTGTADYAIPSDPWFAAPEDPVRDYSIYCNYDELAPPPGWTGKISG
ncbi:unnamed protein product, partial [marine sediment metagenome]